MAFAFNQERIVCFCISEVSVLSCRLDFTILTFTQTFDEITESRALCDSSGNLDLNGFSKMAHGLLSLYDGTKVSDEFLFEMRTQPHKGLDQGKCPFFYSFDR